MRFTASCLLSSRERPRAETPGIGAGRWRLERERGDGGKQGQHHADPGPGLGFSSADGARRKRSALARDAALPRCQLEVQDPRRPGDITGRGVRSAKLSTRKTSGVGWPAGDATEAGRGAQVPPTPCTSRPSRKWGPGP